ncbi:hypothetical protein SUDANB19_01235 [Streptomyces sp. enrichment culture]
MADTSICRRWGNLEALAQEVGDHPADRAGTDPGTGNLEGDLRSYAARDVSGPDGPAVLSLAVALCTAGPDGERTRDNFLAERTPVPHRHPPPRSAPFPRA